LDAFRLGRGSTWLNRIAAADSLFLAISGPAIGSGRLELALNFPRFAPSYAFDMS